MVAAAIAWIFSSEITRKSSLLLDNITKKHLLANNHYAAIIDAGSTGSRIHLYKFNLKNTLQCLDHDSDVHVNCQKKESFQLSLHKEIGFHQVKPGLTSSFATNDDPMDSARSLDELFDRLRVWILEYETSNMIPYMIRALGLDAFLWHNLNRILEELPVLIRATAGLRLIGESKASSIIDAIEKRWFEEEKVNWPGKKFWSEQSPLAVDPVAILDGHMEALYAWITVNHLLELDQKNDLETQKLAVMDLGGASTQIAFEPDFRRLNGNVGGKDLNEDEICLFHSPDAKALISCFATFFHKRKHIGSQKSSKIYRHSHLGYGLKNIQDIIKRKPLNEILCSRDASKTHLEIIENQDEIRDMINGWINLDKLSEHDASEFLSSLSTDTSLVVFHPCISPDVVELVRAGDLGCDYGTDQPKLSKKYHIFLSGGTGYSKNNNGITSSYEKCSKIVERLFEKKTCSYEPSSCSFNNVYQPDIDQSLAQIDGAKLYAFSYFYDRTRYLLHDYLNVENQPELNRWSVVDFRYLAEIACSFGDEKLSKKPKFEEKYMRNWDHLSPHIKKLFGTIEELKAHLAKFVFEKSYIKHNDENHRLPELCLDLTFIYHLLTTGYGLKENRVLTIEKKINGVETGWCVGAALDTLQRQLLLSRNSATI